MMFFHTRSVCLITLACAFAVCHAQSANRARITETIDASRSARLVDSVHPLAKPEADEGRLDSSTLIHGVSIVFRRSSSQEKALQKLLAEQQNRASSRYHKWLTPEQFADRFGLGSTDVEQVVAWLRSEGFVVNSVARSRTQLSFTGSVARLEAVFQTEIHRYVVNGKKHFANATALSIPAALGDVTLAVRNLNDFRPEPRNARAHAMPVTPNFTSNISGNHYLAPKDFATIYNVHGLYDIGIDGSGQKIAVVGDSSVKMSDIATFRSLSGLPSNNPTPLLVPNSGTATVPSAGEQIEAYLDLEWSGAIAKKASIIYVYVGNNRNYSVWDALQYAIDHNTAPVISISFGYCEPGLGASNAAIIRGWAQQANAQGQTISAASGDSGAADCDYGAVSASQGLAVDLPASVPEVTGVGGTMFTGDPPSTETTPYWNGSNDSDNGSALSYIPEEGWNDTTESVAQGGGLAAGGGGASAFFSKPSWQTGAGVPGDGRRDVPDISLNASPFHDPYLTCIGTAATGVQSCTNGFRDKDNNLRAVGGTSAGAPAIAGILALLNQAMQSNGQGNVNSTLYSLAAGSSSAFHDITSGDNKVPCTRGSADCANGGTIGYSAGAGYDQASGIGSLDAFTLVTNWPGYTPSPNYSLSASPASITISAAGKSGASTVSVTAMNGFSGTVSLSCKTSSSTAGIGCSLSPTSLALDNEKTSATATLTLSTTPPSVRPIRSNTLFGRVMLTGGGVAILGLMLVAAPRRRRTTILAFLACATIIISNMGCGGGNSNKGTPAGSYTVTVTGVSGNMTRDVQVSVTVQ